jgi:nucleoid-associated protein YgaU
MQPIERYGLIALIFLVITIAAACLWEPKEDKPADKSSPVASAASEGSAEASPRSRDYVGARTQDKRAGQGISERQRERLVALEEEAGTSELGAEDVATREAKLARREAALAARGLDGAPVDPAASLAPAPAASDAGRTHLGERADELLSSAAAKAKDLVDLARPGTEKPASAPATKRTYVVQKGDTLSEIASKELGTWKRWQEIVAANPGLDPSGLRVGARLALPGGGPAAQAERPSAAKTLASETPRKAASSYVVQSNDSLWKIAAKTLGDGERWREIAELNPDIDPDVLVVGATLRLPGGAAAAPRAGDERVAKAEPERRGKVR